MIAEKGRDSMAVITTMMMMVAFLSNATSFVPRRLAVFVRGQIVGFYAACVNDQDALRVS